MFFNNFLFLSPFLVLSFTAGNILIAIYFKQDNALHVYFIDLLGAAAGVFCTVLLIPLMREENCFILLSGLLILSIYFTGYGVTRPWRWCGAVVFIAGILGWNMAFDTINLTRITQPSKSTGDDKIFARMDALYKMDARTFFMQHQERFDIITLMNTHVGRNAGLVGTPEYMHTLESITACLDHLTDRGFMILEKKYNGQPGWRSILCIIHTLMVALNSRWGLNPADHLYVYHWRLHGLSILGDPEANVVSHVMIAAKKQPYTIEDRGVIRGWAWS